MPSVAQASKTLSELLDKYDSIAAKESLDESEEEEMSALGPKIDAATKAVEEAKRTEAAVAAARPFAKPAPRARVSTPTAPGSAPVQVESNFEKDPKKGFGSAREFFSKVIEASTKNVTDERLAYLSGRRNEFKATAGSDEHSTFSDPYGGFLVPAAFIANLLTTSYDGDLLAGRTTNIPMASPVVHIPARVDKTHTSSVSGGLRVYRRAEADTVSSSRMETELIELQATALMGVSYATEEILRDSAISIGALLEAGFREEFGSKLMQERLTGTGAGQFLGVLNSPALVSVAKESGQAADTILYDNIIKMRARVWRYNDAIWLANHDVFPQLAKLSQVIGTGGSNVWMPSINADRPDMLLGRPIFFHEDLATVGDVGDLICCNWSQYLEGTRVGITSEESIHVRFLNYERAFRFTMENAGAPWWRAALTPKKGASTLSPFVALAARA